MCFDVRLLLSKRAARTGMAWGRGSSESVADGWARRLTAQDASFTSLCVLPSRSFSHEDVAKLCAALESNTTLTELSASGHCMVPETAALVAVMLGRNSTLQGLSLGDGSFGDAGAAALAPGLAASPSLQRLDLSAKGLGADGAGAIGRALAQNPGGTLTTLRLAGNAGVGDSGLGALVQGLASLRSLDLSACGLGGDATALRQILLQGSLTSLRLDGNALGPKAGAALAAGVSEAAALRELAVAGTGLGDEGLSALAAALPGCGLTRLDAASCGAGRGGAAAVFKALARGAPLVSLSLRDNALGRNDLYYAITSASPPQGRHGKLANGGPALDAPNPDEEVPGLGRCALRELDLSENDGRGGDGGAAAAYSSGGGRDELGIGGGPEYNSGADAPALAALVQLDGLERVSLFGCGGGAGLAAELSAQLPAGSWPALRELDIGGNDLTREQLQSILRPLEKGSCPTLQVLLLGANPGSEDPEAFAEVAAAVLAARPGLDLVFRAAGGMAE